MPVDAEAFKKALGCWPSGVTVITTKTEDGWHGMTASAFSSLSLDPPLVLVCVAKKAEMHGHLERGLGFAIHVLAEGQKHTSNWFAGYRPDGVAEPLTSGSAEHCGAPLLDGSMAVLDCSHHAALDGGDHTIYVGQVQAASVSEGAAPLLYAQGAYRGLGGAL